ncbi:MAG: YciI family protein [Mycobacteriaceae bacterium]
MPLFAVHYTYTYTTTNERNKHRPEHREWLSALIDSGDIISSGPYVDGSGALIIASGKDLSTVTTTFNNDPFAIKELISSRHIVEWDPVLGLLS